jgi:hypothetical protein
MTTNCPIVLKTALNHIMQLYDENHGYFVAFSKKRNWTNQQSKTMVSDNNKNSAPLGKSFLILSSARFVANFSENLSRAEISLPRQRFLCPGNLSLAEISLTGRLFPGRDISAQNTFPGQRFPVLNTFPG